MRITTKHPDLAYSMKVPSQVAYDVSEGQRDFLDIGPGQSNFDPFVPKELDSMPGKVISLYSQGLTVFATIRDIVEVDSSTIRIILDK